MVASMPSPGLPVLWRSLRPPFLIITAVAYAIGTATAWRDDHRTHPGLALLGLALTLTAHAAANVLNDHEDARNGTDAANHHAIAPFTGGAGLIQRGELDLRQTRGIALSLLLVVFGIGGVLALQVAPVVMALGIGGVFLGWSYSAPPFAWMRRGLGEAAVALAWLGVVLGADGLLRGGLSVHSLLAGGGFALLVADILLVNGFPDADGDAATGKRTLRVHLGADGAASVSALLVLVAHCASAWALQRLHVPAWPLVLLSMPLALWASHALWRERHHPQRLRPAIVATLVTAHLHGALIVAALAIDT